jgi:hypothetical protein
LVAVPGVSTRPTADRVREALFSRLQSRYAITGITVLDLFAGTGALGIEAIAGATAWKRGELPGGARADRESAEPRMRERSLRAISKMRWLISSGAGACSLACSSISWQGLPSALRVMAASGLLPRGGWILSRPLTKTPTVLGRLCAYAMTPTAIPKPLHESAKPSSTGRMKNAAPSSRPSIRSRTATSTSAGLAWSTRS